MLVLLLAILPLLIFPLVVHLSSTAETSFFAIDWIILTANEPDSSIHCGAAGSRLPSPRARQYLHGGAAAQRGWTQSARPGLASPNLRYSFRVPADEPSESSERGTSLQSPPRQVEAWPTAMFKASLHTG